MPFAALEPAPDAPTRRALRQPQSGRLALTPELLLEVSRHQVARIARRFDELELDPAVISRDRGIDLEGVGVFLALRAPRAGELQQRLLRAGVFTDARGSVLRLGPAPYLCDAQIDEAVAEFGRVVRSL